MPPFAPDPKLVLLATALAALASFTLVWLLSLRMKDASIVDAWWGPGFIVLTGIALLMAVEATPVTLILFAMTALWAMRLGLHIGLRKLGEPHEDPRYVAMRRSFGDGFAWKSLVYIFALQASLQWLVALPLVLAIALPGQIHGPAFIAGIAVFAIGLTIEAIADWQLAQFKKNRTSPDQVCDVGLWAWSRHPNYFGETTLWWGLFLAAWSAGAPLWTIVSPLTMTFLLLRVSGVTLLEKGLKARKPAYADYVKRTSAFIPWPPGR